MAPAPPALTSSARRLASASAANEPGSLRPGGARATAFSGAPSVLSPSAGNLASAIVTLAPTGGKIPSFSRASNFRLMKFVYVF